ncbi:endonuclease/exonuclease/phosphatase family protein [Diaminobutyricimonas sp. LJ205]|uniref:endonuclease/exonuclease/phosphatase family protein n=1 Tax=Diaminobutyricimonas sp. LJ205 TaxID=2683590 RepID=UPI0012F48592|nr:endonuclease/exonuclease/phosphatase family protein [Diaminobutyricimonas sp. LJ205]
MFARLLAALVTLIAAVCLLVAVWPQLFGLEQAPIIAQVVSARGALLAGTTLAALALVIGALAFRPARRFFGTLAALCVGFALVTAIVLGTRGFGNPADTAAPDSVTVLTWNTLGDAPGAQVIADLAVAEQADVVALPETTEATGVEIAKIMRDSGRPMWVHTRVFDPEYKAQSTTLLISPDLGTYTPDESAGDTRVLPSVVARPDDGDGPVIAAVHPVAPVPQQMRNWRADLEWVSGLCSDGSTIVAGDFNATLDHMEDLAGDSADLGTCVDAAVATGNGAVGTWPTSLPALVGTPIDHVMATPDWTVSGMRVIDSHDDHGSDHRPVVAHLTRTAGTTG